MLGPICMILDQLSPNRDRTVPSTDSQNTTLVYTYQRVDLKFQVHFGSVRVISKSRSQAQKANLLSQVLGREEQSPWSLAQSPSSPSHTHPCPLIRRLTAKTSSSKEALTCAGGQRCNFIFATSHHSSQDQAGRGPRKGHGVLRTLFGQVGFLCSCSHLSTPQPQSLSNLNFRHKQEHREQKNTFESNRCDPDQLGTGNPGMTNWWPGRSSRGI